MRAMTRNVGGDAGRDSAECPAGSGLDIGTG